MLEIVGLFLGIVGVVVAFETPRRKFVSLFRPDATESIVSPAPTAQVAATRGGNTSTFGATQSGRTPFFISEPFLDLAKARDESRKTRKPVFVVIYDDEHPTKSKLDYSLGCFLDYFTTKRLVDQHFVCALVPASSAGARAYVPENDPLENALLVVLSPDGDILRREGVYANPDEGMKRVRAVIAEHSDA
jgi:hypothetical protein